MASRVATGLALLWVATLGLACESMQTPTYTTVRRHPEFHARCREIETVAVLPPEVQVSLLRFLRKRSSGTLVS